MSNYIYKIIKNDDYLKKQKAISKEFYEDHFYIMPKNSLNEFIKLIDSYKIKSTIKYNKKYINVIMVVKNIIDKGKVYRFNLNNTLSDEENFYG